MLLAPRKRKRFFLLFRCGVALLAALILVVGCSPPAETVAETDSRTYRRGKSLQREGRSQEALLAFLQVVDERAVAPESHLEAGLIYLNHLRDPLSAIYHFNRYLQFKGDGDQAETVRELIVTAQKEFLRHLPGEPFATQVERLDLTAKFDEAQRQNESLRTELAGLRRELERAQEQNRQLREGLATAQAADRSNDAIAPIVVAQTVGSGANQPAQERPSSYVVESGDTLSSISRKVYGNSGRWMDIYQANRDQLPSPNALRVGQELRVP